MTDNRAKILVVDDEPMNIRLIAGILKEEGYRLIIANNGEDAWALLQETPDDFATVLLDRMMPGIDGMEVLLRMKKNPELKIVPVIFQTAKASDEEILEGLKAGAFYYLTKPFDKDTLVAVVKTSVQDCMHYKSLKSNVDETMDALNLLTTGSFEFRTLDEAKSLSALLAYMCPEPKKSVLGLWELMLNGVEHGNLGITYDEKSELNDANTWHVEVERRLNLPENIDKKVTIQCEKQKDKISFLVTDGGEGFNWQEYVELSPDRAFDNHGRGIAMAGMQSFDTIEYRGNGNEVEATIIIERP